MIKIKNNILIAICALLCLSQSHVNAKGLAVAPVTYHMKNVTLGKMTASPVAINIKNKSKGVTSYTLRVVTPGDLKCKIDKGFNELPNKSWVSFEQKHIVVNPGEIKRIKLYVNIPNRKQYALMKWQFYVEVKEHNDLGQVFALACYPKFNISTDDYKREQKKEYTDKNL